MDRDYAVILPYSRARSVQELGLANPATWFALDLNGTIRQTSVNRLATIVSDVNAGCYYLANDLLGQKGRLPIRDGWITPENLFFSFTSRPLHLPAIRRSVSGPQYFKGGAKGARKDVLDALQSPTCRKALGHRYTSFVAELAATYTQSFLACLDKTRGVETVCLVGWVAEGEKYRETSNLWSVCRQKDGILVPISAYANPDHPVRYEANFQAAVVAALDLDGDGIDEILFSAAYYEGRGYKIFGFVGDRLKEIYESSYYGL